jgi:hypothetical protein
MNDHRWVHVHEMFYRPNEFWPVERCLGDVPRREAAEYYSEAIEDSTGRTTYWWFDDVTEETCWIGLGKAVC